MCSAQARLAVNLARRRKGNGNEMRRDVRVQTNGIDIVGTAALGVGPSDSKRIAIFIPAYIVFCN